MAETYYAWTPIRYKKGDEIKETKLGDKVDKGSVGVNESEWKLLVDSGAVRTLKFPDMGADVNNMSPIDFLRRKAKNAGSDELERLSAEVVNLTLPEGVEPVEETAGVN